MNANVVWDCRCVLGEGAVWHEADQTLYFVDIKRPAVHAYTPRTDNRRSWAMEEKIGWLVPRREGGWVAGFQTGVALLWLDNAPRVQWMHRLQAADSPLRLNDAKADASGCLWFGTMNNDDETRPEGRLYRLDPDHTLAVVDDGYCVTNGPCLSLDGRTLYHTDSVARTIYAYDIGPGRALSNKRAWKRIEGSEAEEGYPDGMCTDADGHLWVARWGAGCVTRLDGRGRETLRVRTGAPRTTNCCFGGPDLTDLYITSARIGLDDAALAQAPASGALLVAPAAGRGMLPHAFAG
jgi:sugar lactone lactonase YvrE